ncbi:hypothetical protein [Novosphingobium sp. PP1Y]|uniref:glucosamine inositolphosphorylceramide transferase family protein n=1 Tax=Novosphingobium sp. PP1Y TaxID=702113 RepID=UPI001E4B7ABD|nr:hypothetical protein [Novosphingobium sp. PP1Y]
MRMQALRIAIVLPTPDRPAGWCTRLVEQIEAEPRFDLRTLIACPSGMELSSGNGLIRTWYAFERRVVGKLQGSDPLDGADRPGKFPILASDDHLAIVGMDLDVIVDLSGRAVGIFPSEAARLGIWYPDFLRRPAGTTAMAAILARDPVIAISLLRGAADKEETTIATGRLNTKFLATRNEDFMLEKAVPLIVNALKRAHQSQASELPSLPRSAEPLQPGGSGLCTYLARLGGDGAAKVVEKVGEKLGARPGMFFLKSYAAAWSEFDPARATPHVSARNSYFADPFLWERAGALYCFFEEFDYRTGRGHISVGRFEDGQLTDIQVALRRDYHLSFPHLFEHEGELYMMPECCEVRRLEVWKCRAFPHDWELHATALEGVVAADSTLNLIDGNWWLFTNISDDAFLDMNTQLHIFRADGPDLAKLEPHALNPVVVDAREARNAGRILDLDGRLYRPAQDNSHGTYGYGVRLMEIEDLSLDNYRESLAYAIEPDFEPGITGCHHFDVRAGRVVMDVRRRVGGFAGLARGRPASRSATGAVPRVGTAEGKVSAALGMRSARSQYLRGSE